MGQQQLLLIILGVIIVGIAIAVGLNLFQQGSIGANQDAMISDVMNIASHADQWRIRPTAMGGGDGDFTGYMALFNADDQGAGGLTRLSDTGNGEYEITAESATSITILGTSKLGFGTVTLEYTPSNPEETRYVWGGTHEGGI